MAFIPSQIGAAVQPSFAIIIYIPIFWESAPVVFLMELLGLLFI